MSAVSTTSGPVYGRGKRPKSPSILCDDITPAQPFDNYGQVSIKDQILGFQIDALKAAGCATICQAHASDKDRCHPELAHAQKAFRNAHTPLVSWLNRLGRLLTRLVPTAIEVESLRASSFELLTERIEIASVLERLASHLLAALAEHERNLVSARTRERLSAARVPVNNSRRTPKFGARDFAQVKAFLPQGSTSAEDVANAFA